MLKEPGKWLIVIERYQPSPRILGSFVSQLLHILLAIGNYSVVSSLGQVWTLDLMPLISTSSWKETVTRIVPDATTSDPKDRDKNLNERDYVSLLDCATIVDMAHLITRSLRTS